MNQLTVKLRETEARNVEGISASLFSSLAGPPPSPPGRRLFHCQQCSYATPFSSSLKTHRRLHTGERPYQCSHCGKAFVQTSHLHYHQRLHTGERPHQCSHCGKAFVQTSHLHNHLRIHTGERPHQCSHCGKAFLKKDTLVSHLRTHTGERPFRCHLCPMDFAVRATLDSHVRNHTGERPFRCRFCPETFKYRLRQKKHEDKEHGQCQPFALFPPGHHFHQATKELRARAQMATMAMRKIAARYHGCSQRMDLWLYNTSASSRPCNNSIDRLQRAVGGNPLLHRLHPQCHLHVGYSCPPALVAEMHLEIPGLHHCMGRPTRRAVTLANSDGFVWQRQVSAAAAAVLGDATRQARLPYTASSPMTELIQKGNPHSLLVRAVRNKAARLAELGTRLQLQWMPGHIGLEGNKRVAQAAGDDAHLMILQHEQVQWYARPLERHHHLRGPPGCHFVSWRAELLATLRLKAQHLEEVLWRPGCATEQDGVHEALGPSPSPPFMGDQTQQLCSYVALSSSQLSIHQRKHMGEHPNQCKYCFKAFGHRCSLVTHLRTHTGERPFQCSQCGKAFVQKNHLHDHLRVHTGERPHQCHLCPNAFTQKATLDRHVRTHTGDRPFRCRFCPKAFTQYPHRKKHEEKVHSHS
ncbi:uncharacterized protein LOC144179894 [Haemaphysalis longicornis]